MKGNPGRNFQNVCFTVTLAPLGSKAASTLFHIATRQLYQNVKAYSRNILGRATLVHSEKTSQKIPSGFHFTAYLHSSSHKKLAVCKIFDPPTRNIVSIIFKSNTLSKGASTKNFRHAQQILAVKGVGRGFECIHFRHKRKFVTKIFFTDNTE